MTGTLTEKDVIKHVSKYGRFLGERFITPYYVSWNGKGYSGKEPRDLVVKICQDEGIEVK